MPVTGWPRAVLADDHAVTRIGMRRALEHVGVRAVEEATDASGAVEAVRRIRPDLCLLDVRLPGDGIAATAEIAVTAPATCVVVLCAGDADEDVLAALRAGASGCLDREISPPALGRAVRAMLAGEASLPRAATARVVEELRARWGQRRVRTATGAWTTLSAREAEVLELMRRRLTTQQVAERLGISTVTVRRHLSDAVRRLGAPDREAALRLVTARRPVHRDGVAGARVP